MKNQHLNERGNFVRLWEIRSEELYKAAETVWNSDVIYFTDGSDDTDKLHMQYRPATLLMGLSLETLLKGCIISKEPLSLGDYYPKKLSTHNLNSLYELAGFNSDTEETEFLNHLTAAIEWTSKYPIPKKESPYGTNFLMRNDGHFIIFNKIYSKILKILK